MVKKTALPESLRFQYYLQTLDRPVSYPPSQTASGGTSRLTDRFFPKLTILHRIGTSMMEATIASITSWRNGPPEGIQNAPRQAASINDGTYQSQSEVKMAAQLAPRA